jgi:hypothetical protein
MSKLLVAAVAVGAIAAFNLAPQPAQARHCSVVVTKVRGVTPGIAVIKAKWRLQRYAARNFSGWHVRAVSNTCQRWGTEGLRPVCKSGALVCS